MYIICPSHLLFYIQNHHKGDKNGYANTTKRRINGHTMYNRHRSIIYWLTTILQGSTYSIAIHSARHGNDDYHHAHCQCCPCNHDHSRQNVTLAQSATALLKILYVKSSKVIEFNSLTCYNKRKRWPTRK